MLQYVKPDRRFLYIKRNLKQDEIDYEKIAADNSIPLKIDFFKNNWRKISFKVLLSALCKRFTEKQARDFISTEIPKQAILDNIECFIYKPYIGYIEDIDLSKLCLKSLHKKLGVRMPITLAYFVNQNNLNYLKVFRYVFIDSDMCWDGKEIFLSNVNNEGIYKNVLNPHSDNLKPLTRRQLAYIEEIYYSKYPQVFEQNLFRVRYNSKLKGTLWIKSIWRGLKNIAQKALATLSSPMK